MTMIGWPERGGGTIACADRAAPAPCTLVATRTAAVRLDAPARASLTP